jgi:hypothetical protein
VRAGRPLRFPTDGTASPARAAGVTDRIWACVSLQWEWLGGARADRPAVTERRAPRTFVRRRGGEQPARAEREAVGAAEADSRPSADEASRAA